MVWSRCPRGTWFNPQFTKGSYSTMRAAVWALVPLLSILSTVNAGEVKPVIASQIRGLDPARKCASIAKGGVTPSSLAVNHAMADKQYMIAMRPSTTASHVLMEARLYSTPQSTTTTAIVQTDPTNPGRAHARTVVSGSTARTRVMCQVRSKQVE